ncbi:MAG: PAS domain S-box protein [Planctomycetes bacterium]|nr:PAS domain S-box protein [Planctomycetota bacterium]
MTPSDKKPSLKTRGRIQMLETRLQHLQSALRNSEDRFIKVFHNSPAAILITRPADGLIIDINDNYLKMAGYRHRDDVIGSTVSQLNMWLNPEDRLKMVEALTKSGAVHNMEAHFRHKSGEIRHGILSAILINYNGQECILTISRDITEHKRVDEEIKKTKTYLESILNNSLDVIFTVKKDGSFGYLNRQLEKVTGYTPEQIRGKHFIEFIPPRLHGFMMQKWQEINNGIAGTYETEVIKADGSIIHCLVSHSVLEGFDEFIVTMRDISEIRQQTRDLNLLYDTAKIFASSLDLAKTLREVSRRCTEILRVDSVLVRLIENNRLVVKGSFYRFDDDKQEVENLIRQNPIEVGKGIAGQVAQSGKSMVSDTMPLESVTLPGYLNYLSQHKWMVVPLKAKDCVIGVLTFMIANTSRKFSAHDIALAEGIANQAGVVIENAKLFDQLRESEERFRRFSDVTMEGIVIHEKGKILDMNQALARMLGYKPAELIGQDGMHMVAPEYRDVMMLKITANDTRPYEVICIRKDGTRFPVEIIARAFVYQDRTVRVGAIRDITERKNAESELKESYQRLQKTMEGAVYALSLTTQKRDPYTTSHQQRVADLACAIAREMKLSDEQIECLHMAGILHDIGKLRVPPEILTKFAPLTVEEKDALKSHLEAGYEILKNIPFTWPVAHIVIQHHERCNGTGYPKQLKGEDIRMEARILAVADTVEAITFNRPYRPALGIDHALEEISRHKNTLYDPAVVDTCLKLFNDNKFRFAQTEEKV